MNRFSINNIFRDVSLDQFKNTAERLELSLRKDRPEITSELLLNTNRYDYDTYGSLTIIIPELEEALKRREKYQLSDLNEELWKKSFEIGLYIKDNSIKEPYMVCLTGGIRESKKMFFYSQCLDEKSQEVFDSFKKTGLLQKIGDGFGKSSDFAVSYASASLDSK